MTMMHHDVQVVESCLVAPGEDTPRKILWLSPLDVFMANRGHTPNVYLYRNIFDLGRLKAALAKALVAFYPLAGRLSMNADGRPEVDCNAEGALFVVARSELTVDELSDFHKPLPEMRTMFLPRIEPESIMLFVQVTMLRCGGVALGMAMHHILFDASGGSHFFQTWSALCRDGDSAVVELPYHDRELLRARSPPVVHPRALSVFRPELELCDDNPSEPTASVVFRMSGEHVAALRRLCDNASTFCAVSAHVWRCVCEARQLPPDVQTRLSFPASIRRRIDPPLPSHFSGNAIVWLSATGAARDITSEELASVAGRIRGTLNQMDNEVVRSAIDYFALTEGKERPVIRGKFRDTELRVISTLGMPMYDGDFGWGKQQAMTRADFRGGLVGLMDEEPEDGGGAVRVLMCMEAANISEFERLLYANFIRRADI